MIPILFDFFILLLICIYNFYFNNLEKLKPGSDLVNDLKKGMKLLGTNNETKSLGEGDLEKVNKLRTILFFSTVVYKREPKSIWKVQDCITKLKNDLNYDVKVEDVYEEIY